MENFLDNDVLLLIEINRRIKKERKQVALDEQFLLEPITRSRDNDPTQHENLFVSYSHLDEGEDSEDNFISKDDMNVSAFHGKHGNRRISQYSNSEQVDKNPPRFRRTGIRLTMRTTPNITSEF